MATTQSASTGERKHRMLIQAPIGVLSETEAVDVATEYMKIAVLPPAFQARESLAVGGLRTQTLYNVTSRYRTDLRPSFVLLEQCCTERQFQILSVVPSDRRDVLDMTCVTNG